MPHDLSRSALKTASQVNKGTPCNAPGCTNKRSGMSHYCRKHTQRRQELGGVDVIRLQPKHYANEIEQVEELLTLNPDNAGIKAGCGLIDYILKLAYETPLVEDESKTPELDMGAGPGIRVSHKIPAFLHLKRIANRATPSLEILITLCAVYAYVLSGKAGDHGDKSREVLAKLLGTRFIYIRPLGSRHGANQTDRLKLGEWCLDKLGPVLVRVAVSLRERANAEGDAREAMRASFRLTGDTDE